jgi:hypothetical protein
VTAVEAARIQANADKLAVFGQPVLYTPAGSSPVTVAGIWDTSDQARGRGQDQLSGRLWLVAGTLAFVPAKNDSFVIDGVTYRVVNTPPDDYDGSGGVFLHARKR